MRFSIQHVSDHLKNSKIKLNKGTTHICSRHFDSNQLKVDRRGKKKVNDEAYPHLYLPGTEDDIEVIETRMNQNFYKLCLFKSEYRFHYK